MVIKMSPIAIIFCIHTPHVMSNDLKYIQLLKFVNLSMKHCNFLASMTIGIESA
jgi:hypothetical protein